MDNEQDLIVFKDDDGNELTLEVLDYFFYNGQEYAVLTESEAQAEETADQEEDDADSLYIMQVVQVDDEMEEFIPVEEDLMETLVNIVMTRFDEEE